jgi:NADPH:quinone reductase-like Zn-dependent oxidoreductase
MPDCLIRAGTYSVMPPLPATPGTELAGIIEKVGPGVTTRQEGQRVYTTARERPHRGGHYAEYVATPTEATFLLPDTVDFEAAAALANYQVAYHIFNDALCLRRGETVLIFAAAGGMGNALIDLAKTADLKVIGVVSSEEKAGFVRALGADDVINRKAVKVSERVNEITRGRALRPLSIRWPGLPFLKTLKCLRPAGRCSSTVRLAERRNSISCQRHACAETRRQFDNSPSIRGIISLKSAALACALSSICLRPESSIRAYTLVYPLAKPCERTKCWRAVPW